MTLVSGRTTLSRREALASAALLTGNLVADSLAAKAKKSFQVTTFSTEVTVPLGHALMGGGVAPAKKIVDPLFAHGIVLLGSDKPIVIVSVDWCEIRNDAFERWRTLLAEAVKTAPRRVLVSCIHQHDAPV